MIQQHKEPVYPQPGPERVELMDHVALQDLEELQNELLLIRPPFIWRNGINKVENSWSYTTLINQVGAPMDLWSF